MAQAPSPAFSHQHCSRKTPQEARHPDGPAYTHSCTLTPLSCFLDSTQESDSGESTAKFNLSSGCENTSTRSRYCFPPGAFRPAKRGRGRPRANNKSMHALDNVIWQALTTRQTEFAEAAGPARCFVREVTSLSGFEAPNDEGYAALAELVGAEGTAAVFLDEDYEARAGWDRIGGAPLVQMVCENGHGSATPNRSAEIVELGVPDSPEMVALTALTKPGPFGTRTHELGYYVGIRQEGKLVAMAGERLKVPGYTEVSAVCTHPDHLGRGYAGALMTEVMRQIRERGETPFLHVRADNARAIALYERLGFAIRHRGYFAVLRRSDGDSL